LGADETIDRNENEGKWVDKVLSLTGGKGVDIIIDFVGASYWEQNLAALAMGTPLHFRFRFLYHLSFLLFVLNSIQIKNADGTMVMLAFLSGSQIPSCDIAAILRKRYTCLTLERYSNTLWF
jgi:threonine dehydrogenase-like Zn-dependent dehydrogenase